MLTDPVQLVMLCGLPASGKTARAAQIAEFCRRRAADETTPGKQVQVVLLSDHDLGVARSAYAQAATEKTARATVYSAVKRALARDTVVVLDHANYIKGWRYQLHTEAKNASTPSCVVQVGASADGCRATNDARIAGGASVGGSGASDAWEPAVLDDLIMRFEEPDPQRGRWDRPCYVVAADDEMPPLEKIWEDIVVASRPGPRQILTQRHGTAARADAAAVPAGGVRPNLATVAPAAGPVGGLQAVDRVVGEVVKLVLGAARDGLPQIVVGGDGTDVENDDDTHHSSDRVSLALPADRLLVSVGALARRRSEFVSQQRRAAGMPGVRGVSAARARVAFAQYLSDSWAVGSRGGR